ncbi:E3 ubiquitin-protein ligase HERC2 isoform X3, partial [Ixodes scapularis]
SGVTPTEPKGTTSGTATPSPTFGSGAVQSEEGLLEAIGEGRLDEPLVASFLHTVDAFCEEQHLALRMDFAADHPVEEVG